MTVEFPRNNKPKTTASSGSSSNQPDQQEMVTIPKAQLTALQYDYETFKLYQDESIRLTQWMRAKYAREIREQEPQHRGNVVDAAIHYLGIERSRPRVVLANLVQRLMGVGGAGE